MSSPLKQLFLQSALYLARIEFKTSHLSIAPNRTTLCWAPKDLVEVDRRIKTSGNIQVQKTLVLIDQRLMKRCCGPELFFFLDRFQYQFYDYEHHLATLHTLNTLHESLSTYVSKLLRNTLGSLQKPRVEQIKRLTQSLLRAPPGCKLQQHFIHHGKQNEKQKSQTRFLRLTLREQADPSDTGGCYGIVSSI